MRTLPAVLTLALFASRLAACTSDDTTSDGPGVGGQSGVSGGIAGTTGASGSSGTSSAGSAGSASGTGGTAGSSGHAGMAGASASAGSSGESGAAGSSTTGGANGASGTAGVSGTAGAGGMGGMGGTGGTGTAPCILADSGPVQASSDGQIIENLRITSDGQPAIQVSGFHDVIVRNVDIRHAGAPGIQFSSAAGLHIENVSIEHTGAPATGANDSEDRNNIDGYDSADVTIVHARLTRGSSGIYLVQSPGSTLQFIEGHDMRGPFPRGQLVQWNNSSNAVLEDFSVINPATSWPEDNVNIYQSQNVTVRRGLIDGNNSPSGVGVIFDGGNGAGLVEDVDAVRMGNGCFSAYAGQDGSTFRRTRCRDNICTDQGRGLPGSNALMFCGQPGLTQLHLEQSSYYEACNPGNIVWPQDSFAVDEVTEEDFTLRAPITNQFCWE